MLTASEVSRTGTYHYYEWVGGAPQRATVSRDEQGRLLAQVGGQLFELATLSGLFEGPLA